MLEIIVIGKLMTSITPIAKRLTGTKIQQEFNNYTYF